MTKISKEGWCLALPLVEERPFTSEEAAQLRQQRRRAVVGSVLLGIFGTAGSFAACFGALMLSAHNLGLMALAFILGPVLIVLCAVQGYRFLEHARLAGRELRNGMLQRYAGPLEKDNLALVRVRVGKALKLTLEVGVCCELQVYAGTGRLISASGRPYHGWDIILPCCETAATPEYATTAARWLDEVGTTDTGAPVFAGKRDLSPEELEEMRVIAFHAWWRPCRPLVFIVIICTILILAALLNHKPYAFPLGMLIFIGVFALLPVLRGFILAHRLHCARRLGVIGILRVPADTPEKEDIEVEILIDSKILWTQHGHPAPWRRAQLTRK